MTVLHIHASPGQDYVLDQKGRPHGTVAQSLASMTVLDGNQNPVVTVEVVQEAGESPEFRHHPFKRGFALGAANTWAPCAS